MKSFISNDCHSYIATIEHNTITKPKVAQQWFNEPFMTLSLNVKVVGCSGMQTANYIIFLSLK